MVDYTFTEEQELFRESIKEFCASEIIPKTEKLEGARQMPKDIIKAMANFELLGMVIDPEYDGIQTQIELIQSNRTFDSRYGYLLEAKIVTTNQLQNALAISKKTNKSVEFVLMDQNRIEREDIGKSLAYYYNYPFITFNSEIPVPYELLSKLKKAFLIQNSWVPLSWDLTSKTVEIAIDDPTDLVKTDHIAALMKTKNIKYFIGIKEDITDIINYFFKMMEFTS